MVKYRHPKRYLLNAVKDLATGQGDVRSRLLNIYYDLLIELREEDFPKELQKEYNHIVDGLTKKGARINLKGEITITNVKNTMKHIYNSTGSKIAERIVNLYFKLQNY
jgi:hypothetical protein